MRVTPSSLAPTFAQISEQMRTSCFSHMTIDERDGVHDGLCEIYYELLKESLLTHPVFSNSHGTYLYLIFSLDEVASICEKQDVARLITLLDTHAVQVSRKEFTSLTCQDEIQKCSGVFAYFTCHVLLTSDYIRIFTGVIRETRKCAACQKRGMSLPKCSCKAVYYCNAECQNQDWKVHKKTCSSRKN